MLAAQQSRLGPRNLRVRPKEVAGRPHNSCTHAELGDWRSARRMVGSGSRD